MVHILPQLPYKYDALKPFLDTQTMQLHHGKHHQTYVDKLNEALKKYPLIADKKVEELLENNLAIVPEEIKTAIKNHGGGHVNHTIFWESLSPSKQDPSETFKALLEKEFLSFEKFKEMFSNAAITQFGSGWAWLVYNKKTKMLEVFNMPNQNSPISEGKLPLLTLDVWEHAYYLKYQNRRAEYVQAFWNNVNWQKVEERYNSAHKVH